jgi:AIPR protein
MDRITTSLLDEFSAEHGLSGLSEEECFEHFASYLNVGRHVGESFDTADVVTGSGGDIGIDAIAVIANGTLVTDPDLVGELCDTNGYLDVAFVFVQAERTSSFETTKIGQFGFGVADFLKELPALPRNAAVAAAGEILREVYTRSSKFKRGNPVCRLYYVTTGRWLGDANLEARRRAVEEDLEATRLFREVEFVPVDADAIQKLYGQTKNAISREFTFAERSVVPEISGVKEAYVGLLPATEFLKLVRDDDGELVRSIFYENVRDFQDYNAVNSEMRDTLASAESRARFALMNNGITVIAKQMQATGNKIFVEDYQIVNGCQTTHVLFDSRDVLDETVMVPLRVIATEDEAVIASIVKATNRQTVVKEEQLIALSDFQKKLERFFQSFPEGQKLFYERRSRQFNNVAGVEKTRIVTLSNLIRSYAAMFREEPHRTTRTYRSLLGNVGKEIFGPSHRLEPYYAAAYAAYRLEFLFRNQLLDPKYKPARYHILFAARLAAAPSHPPRANSGDMRRYAETLMQLMWDASKADRLLQDAAAAVEVAAGGNFDRDHIRTQPFTDRLKDEVSRVAQARGSAGTMTMRSDAPPPVATG